MTDEVCPTCALCGEPMPLLDRDRAIIDIATDLVREEVIRATEKFPTWPTDLVHAAAVV